MKIVLALMVVMAVVYLAYVIGRKEGCLIGYAVASRDRDIETLEFARRSDKSRDFYVVGNYKSVSNILEAGESLNFKNGLIIQDGIHVESTGKEGNPITVSSYKDAKWVEGKKMSKEEIEKADWR